MSAGPYEVYHAANEKIHNNSIDLVNDDLRCLLLDTAHVPNLGAHEFVSDVVAQEHPASGGYVRQTLANSSISSSGGESFHDADDVSFGSNVTISARYLVVYKHVGADAVNDLVYICDLNASGQDNLESSNAAFDIAQQADGLHKITPNQ